MTIATDETEALNVNQKSSARQPESSCIERSHQKQIAKNPYDVIGGGFSGVWTSLETS